MWYIPFVRARRALFVYSYIAAAFTLLGIAIRFIPHTGHTNTVPDNALDLSGFAVGVAGIIAGLATVMGLNLASENDGHLEVAWTKPVSREQYALGVFGVDLVTIFVAYIVTLAFAVVVTDIWIGHQAITFAHPLWQVFAVLAFPFYIYGLVVAASASMKRNRGMSAGLLWPVLIALALALELIRVDTVHAILRAVNTINPIILFSHDGSGHNVMAPGGNYALGFALTAVCLALAMVQWRRMEA
jgi:hypothetical protein